MNKDIRTTIVNNPEKNIFIAKPKIKTVFSKNNQHNKIMYINIL